MYLKQLEFSTFEELDELRSDWDAVKVQSLIVTERVLGVSHKVSPPPPLLTRSPQTGPPSESRA